MKIWVVADTHLGHANLVKRGHRPEGYEEKILKNLKAISRQDLLIHLGDFAFKNHEKYGGEMWLIEGNKVLTLGNHDKGHGYNWFRRHGFNFVCEYFVHSVFGKKILFSHRPMDFSKWDGVELNIHGHSHANAHRDEEHCDFYSDRHIEVALENTNYQPILLRTLIEQWDKKHG